MMSLLELFSRVFPLAKLDNTASHLYPCCYDENHNYDFWTKELPDDTIKDIAKRFVEIIYGVPNYHVFLHEHNSSTWQEIPLFMRDMTVEQLYEIIDDAEVNGFEFKVENGRLIWREKP